MATGYDGITLALDETGQKFLATVAHEAWSAVFNELNIPHQSAFESQPVSPDTLARVTRFLSTPAGNVPVLHTRIPVGQSAAHADYFQRVLERLVDRPDLPALMLVLSATPVLVPVGSDEVRLFCGVVLEDRGGAIRPLFLCDPRVSADMTFEPLPADTAPANATSCALRLAKAFSKSSRIAVDRLFSNALSP